MSGGTDGQHLRDFCGTYRSAAVVLTPFRSRKADSALRPSWGNHKEFAGLKFVGV